MTLPQLGRSSIVVEPNAVPADGFTDASVRVTVLLQDGTPLVGANVQILATNCNVRQQQSVTDTHGAVSGLITSVTAGKQTVSAVVSTSEFQTSLPQTAAVTFESGQVTVAPHQPLQVSVPEQSGTVSFFSSDPNATLPPNYAFTAADTSGHIFTDITFTHIGTQSITVTNVTTGAVVAILIYNVQPGHAQKFSVVPAPTGSFANQPVTLTITALDAYGNVATSYTGEVKIVSSDPLATLPNFVDFLAAQAGTVNLVGACVLRTAGVQTVTVDDTVAQIGGNATIAVQPLMTHVLKVIAPESIGVGAAVSIRISAEDAYGNVTPDFSGTLAFSSSDANAVLPSNDAFAETNQGVVTVPGFIFKTAGVQTITVTVLGDPSVSGQSSLAVQVGDLAALQLASPATTPAGEAFTLSVKAVDTFGNPVTTFVDTVRISCSDTNASIPVQTYTFTGQNAGVGVFSGVVLKTASAQTISVVDANRPSLLASQQIIVTAADANTLLLLANANQTAGSPTTLTLTALDAYGNVALGYGGTVAFQSTDANATLPATYTFNASDRGAHSFTGGVTLRTAGSQTLSANDTQLVGISSPLTVHPAAASALAFTGFPTAMLTCTNPATAFAVSVQDVYGNAVTSSTPTVSLSFKTNPSGAVLSGTLTATASGGIAHFNQVQTNVALQNYFLSATDSAHVLTPAISPLLTVTDAPPKIVSVTSPTQTSGCIGLNYSVMQACGAPVNVIIDYNSTINSNYAAITPCNTAAYGLNQIVSSANASGRALTYQWNSIADAAHSSAQYTIRFRASVNGVFGPSVSETVTLANTQSFANPNMVTTATAPNGITTGDINHDGKPDIISTVAPSSVVVALGDGTGHLALGTAVAANANAQMPLTADINRDGWSDVLALNQNANTVSILLNSGAGALNAATAINVGSHASALALADVNRDGYLDLVVSSATDATLSWALQNPNGSFGAPHSIALGAAPQGIALADVNIDGYPDAVVALPGANAFAVALGSSAGFNTPSGMVSCGTAVQAVSIADMDNDGVLDAVAASAADGTVQVFLGGGDGTFAAQVAKNVGLGASGLALRDFDLDGALDAATLVGGNSVVIALGTAQGTFGASTGHSVGAGAKDLVAADLNRDGLADIAVATNSGFAVLINQTTVSNGWGWSIRRMRPLAQVPVANAVGDFNGDGKPDVMVTTANANVSLLLGDGTGGLGAAMVVAGTGSGPGSVVTADFNGDGALDAAIPSGNANTLTILLNRGAGTFTSATTPAQAYGALSAAAADMTSDGRVDLVVPLYGTNQVAILPNDGNGVFNVSQTYPAGSGPSAVAVGDINGDAYNDVVVIDQVTSHITVLVGDGAGHLTMLSTYTTSPQPRGIAMADFNNDGLLDVAVGCYSGLVQVRLGQGSGALGSLVSTSVASATSLVATDINLDGFMDVILGTDTANAATVALGDGLGQFVANTFVLDQNPIQVSAADINGDSYPDIVSVNALGPSVAALLNNRLNSFVNGVASVAIDTNKGTTLSDINHDGNLDLVVTNSAISKLSLHLGDGAGGFLLAQAIAPTSYTGVGWPVTADFNRDGWLDAGVMNGGSFVSTALYNPSASSFDALQNINLGTSNEQMLRGDFDRNGTADLLVLCASQKIGVALGDGASNFQTAAYTNVPSNVLIGGSMGDIDNNGTSDLTMGDSSNSLIYVMLGNGTGGFTQKTPNITTPFAGPRGPTCKTSTATATSILVTVKMATLMCNWARGMARLPAQLQFQGRQRSRPGAFLWT